MNLCGCKYAKVENSNGRSTTWYYICRLTGQMTDPNLCRGCKNKEPEKEAEKNELSEQRSHYSYS